MSGSYSRRPIHPDGTTALLYRLAEQPQTPIFCSLGEASPAVAIFYTPRGCVARPDDKIQALCLQHIETDGVSEHTCLLVDLTQGEAWSKQASITPPLHLGFTVAQLETVLQRVL